MEAQEAFRRRKETFGKPCVHTSVENLFAQGVYVHVWVCIECGTEFGSYAMWEKLLRNQQQQSTLKKSYIVEMFHYTW
jgi:hypothetical protein